MLCCVFSVSVKSLLAVSGRKSFEERGKARNTDYGAHDVVRVDGVVDNHVRPVVTMLSKEYQSRLS